MLTAIGIRTLAGVLRFDNRGRRPATVVNEVNSTARNRSRLAHRAASAMATPFLTWFIINSNYHTSMYCGMSPMKRHLCNDDQHSEPTGAREVKKAVGIVFSQIGRYASYSLPAGVLIGLIIPSLAEMVQPVMTPGLIIPLTLSLVRIHTGQLKHSAKRLKRIALISIWILLICPLIIFLTLKWVRLPDPIAMATLISAAAPPITACAAIAVFLHLDAALVVVATVVTMLLVPITLPPILFFLVGLEIEVHLWQLSLRLAGFISTAFLAAFILKKVVGQDRIDRQAHFFDGISVLFISLFIIGLMHGVTHLAFQNPWFVFQTFAASTALVLGFYVLTTIAFWRLGPRSAMAVALASGNGNMGLMYLVFSEQAALELLVFFAIGQIPMFFLPAILTPLVVRLNTKSGRRPPIQSMR